MRRALCIVYHITSDSKSRHALIAFCFDIVAEHVPIVAMIFRHRRSSASGFQSTTFHHLWKILWNRSHFFILLVLVRVVAITSFT